MGSRQFTPHFIFRFSEYFKSHRCEQLLLIVSCGGGAVMSVTTRTENHYSTVLMTRMDLITDNQLHRYSEQHKKLHSPYSGVISLS